MKLLKLLVAAMGVAVSIASAQTPGYPNKIVHIIVPFSPGSATDIITRTIADKLSASLGQPVVVENRPGAGGTIGAGVGAGRLHPAGAVVGTYGQSAHLHHPDLRHAA